MDIEAIENRARKLAENAKPGYITIAGKLYTFEFCQKEWVYRVYEDGFLFISFNCKTLNKAKTMFKDWLAS